MSTSRVSGPWRITFDTNPDDCNLHCIMCEEHRENDGHKNHQPRRLMDIDVIHRTVEQMASKGLSEIIPSTMGEPLLYRDFDEIVKISSRYGIKINLTTNGTWPRLGPQKWAEILCHVSSDIKISWNGASAATQEAIMRGSEFSQRLDDLYTFKKVRDDIAASGGNHCRLTFQCTFMETNLDELPDIIRLAADIGIERVKGHHLWVHSPQMQNLDMRRSIESRLRWNRIVEQCRDLVNHYLPEGKNIILENFVPLPIENAEMPPQWTCPFIGKEAWVNHKGRFNPCCAPDVQRRELGMFGYVTEDGGMEAIWDGEKYNRLLHGHMKYSVCMKCNMRRPPGEVSVS